VDIEHWSGISGYPQGDRTAMRRIAGGKLLMDLLKKGVYSSYTLRISGFRGVATNVVCLTAVSVSPHRSQLHASSNQIAG